MASLTVATSGIVSGLANNQQINLISQALATLSASGTAPTVTSTGLTSTANMLWYDSTNNQIKKRNEADTAWLTLFTVDDSSGTLSLPSPIVTGTLTFGATTGVVAALNNSTIIQVKDTGGTSRSAYIPCDASSNTLIFNSGGGLLRFISQNGAVELAHFDNIGQLFTSSGIFATGPLNGTAVTLTGVGQSTVAFTAGNTGLRLNQSGAVAATAVVTNLSNTSSFHMGFLVNGASAGSISSPTSTSVAFNTTSDYRLKVVLSRFDPHSIIDSIPVHEGYFKTTPGDFKPMFLAHEVQVHIPWAVTGYKDEVHQEDLVYVEPATKIRTVLSKKGEIKPQQLDHSALVPVIWAELQSLRKRVKELEDKLT
jgi:hypothetical protein